MFFGLVVNCAKGKTEIILKLRGKSSAAAAASLSARGSLTGTGCGVPKREVAVKLSEGTLLHVGIVPSYKHLGSIVCDDAGLVLEARHRAESAMAAFAKLAGTVFRSPGVNLSRKLLLAKALIFSRLFYNVHTWSSFKGLHRDIINKIYMRVLRSVAAKPRFSAAAWSDRKVRHFLQMPSVDCLVRQRRLCYLTRLQPSDLKPLLAILQATCNGKVMPWIDMICNDFNILKQNVYTCSKLVNVRLPRSDPSEFWRIICMCPCEWKLIVKCYFTVDDDTAINVVVPGAAWEASASPMHVPSPHIAVPVAEPSMAASFACEVCKTAFFTSFKALCQHKRIRHNIRSPIATHIQDISICPICCTDFQSRPRLLAHLSDGRVRSLTRKTSCRAEFLANLGLPSSAVLDGQLRAQQNSNAKQDRRLGKTSPVAVMPAVRGRPATLKGIAAHPMRGILRRRILCKTSREILKRDFPAKTTGHIGFASTLTFGYDSSDIAAGTFITARVSFAQPPKRRKVGGKAKADVVTAISFGVGVPS